MDHFDRVRRALAIAVAFLAGFVDALGFVSADNYFVSFMSGNTTRMAVDVVADPRRALVPALLIAGFVAGVAGGQVAAAKAGIWRKPVLLAMVALLLMLAALLHSRHFGGAALGAMVLAMGAVNNAFQRDGVAVGLTYMTGALVRLGQGLGAALVGEQRTGAGAYVLLWCGLFAGAVVGALSFLWLGGSALWLSGCMALVLAAWAWGIARRRPG